MISFHRPPLIRCAFGVILAAGLLSIAASPLAFAAARTAQATPVAVPQRVVGTVTAIAADKLTVKTDASGEQIVQIPASISLRRVAPGAKDLSSATTIQFIDLAVGDRVLIRVSPDSTADTLHAASLIAIAQTDLAQKQQQERLEWVRNGVGGLVKSVDPASGTIVIVSGAGATQRTITLSTSPATVLRRYAADSVDFDKSTVAPIAAIKVGDQLRARGTKNPTGTEVTADEIVSGSFRNVSGVISSINASSGTITLKDLLTKQNVTIHVTPQTQMRKLPESAARMLAASSQAKPSSAPASGAAAGGMATRPDGMRPDAMRPDAAQSQPATGSPMRNWSQGGGQAGRTGTGDTQGFISRAPAIQLSELKKGDAILLVSTEGSSDLTAITLLAGVEPLLQAPAATQNMLMSGWNMNSGGAEAAAQ